jgi:hypothetical protein
VASHPEATLYHRGPWLEVLRRAFGVRPSVAIMECSDSTMAGCLFAKDGNPLVELPYTMPQDHTLIHLLRRSPMHVWATKAQWIESMGGIILTLVRPGYCGSGRNLDEYENLLIQLNDFQFAWRALPSEVSAWWWRRNQMRLTVDGDSPCIGGPGSGRAAARRLSSEPLAR